MHFVWLGYQHLHISPKWKHLHLLLMKTWNIQIGLLDFIFVNNSFGYINQFPIKKNTNHVGVWNLEYLIFFLNISFQHFSFLFSFFSIFSFVIFWNCFGKTFYACMVSYLQQIINNFYQDKCFWEKWGPFWLFENFDNIT